MLCVGRVVEEYDDEEGDGSDEEVLATLTVLSMHSNCMRLG